MDTIFSYFIRCVFLCAFCVGSLIAQDHQPAKSTQSKSTHPPLRVVATTSMIGDLVLEIGGDAVSVNSLMGEGVDPHLYKAAPGDMRLLTQADLVLYNGLHLEGRMAEALEHLGKRKPVLAVTDSIPRDKLRSPPEFEGNYDPHVWFDVMLWNEAGTHLASILRTHAPHAKAAIDVRAAAYSKKLTELDAWVRDSLAKIPNSRRVLVTAHDAFGYFGRAYGIEVMGIQGINTDSEASIRDMTSLIDIIVARQVPAVFVESSVPRKTIESLLEGAAQRGHTLTIGGELFSDSMGAPGTPTGTYIGMIRHNVEVMVRALAALESSPHTP